MLHFSRYYNKARQKNPGQYFVSCDCKNAVNYTKRLFQLPYYYAETAQNIQEKLAKLKHRGTKIQILWIPGHTDHPWNDRADTLAKQAANSWIPPNWTPPTLRKQHNTSSKKTLRQPTIPELVNNTLSELRRKYQPIRHLTTNNKQAEPAQTTQNLTQVPSQVTNQETTNYEEDIDMIDLSSPPTQNEKEEADEDIERAYSRVAYSNPASSNKDKNSDEETDEDDDIEENLSQHNSPINFTEKINANYSNHNHNHNLNIPPSQDYNGLASPLTDQSTNLSSYSGATWNTPVSTWAPRTGQGT